MTQHLPEMHDLTEIARQAYLYTLPLIIAEATRRAFLASPRNRVNCFHHAHRLLGYRDREVTAPNNDTLYSVAWLDLSAGPVTLSIPKTDERYFSLALMDMYTNNFVILGTRTTGGNGGVYTVVGPTHAVPAGSHRIVRAPTARVWALGRLLVDGDNDLRAALEIQRGLFVAEGAKTDDDIDPGPAVLASADWNDYFLAANRLLKRDSPPVTDRRLLEQIAPLHVGPDQNFDAQSFAGDQVSEIAAGVTAARRELANTAGSLGMDRGAWTYPDEHIGSYGQNYQYRAEIALSYLAALPREEAMYMQARGSEPNGLFDGAQDYVLHFPAGELPPVDSFWSLSLYEATQEGLFFFADTPSHRYTMGDRSPGLTFNADGSLDIWIGAHSPGDTKEHNWLPSSPSAFALVFRCYLPRNPLLAGNYRLPGVRSR